MNQSCGQLAVVAIPIGNLGDLSHRAAEMLQKADILACEDTRMTRKLLTLTGLKTRAKLIPYHDHNGRIIRPRLVAAMNDGKLVALLSDAGTPLISDPGYKLVTACYDANIRVSTIPGPSAVLASLAGAGLPSDRFLFAGFVPSNKKLAKTVFSEFSELSVTSIWFESPRRLSKTLELMLEVFGDRLAVVARELTKLNESFHRNNIKDLLNFYSSRESPKGELVILVSGFSKNHDIFSTKEIETMLSRELGSCSLRDAVQAIAEISGRPRRDIYSLAIKISKINK